MDLYLLWRMVEEWRQGGGGRVIGELEFPLSTKQLKEVKNNADILWVDIQRFVVIENKNFVQYVTVII